MSETENKGATITEMDAEDMVGRLVINPNGAEFIITKLSFNARSASVWIYVAALEPGDDEAMPDAEYGLENLAGWEIHQYLGRPA